MSRRLSPAELIQILTNNPDAAIDERVSALGKRTELQRVVGEAKRDELERAFATLWIQCGGDPDFWQKTNIPGYPGYEQRYELDFYNAAYKVAVEIQGGQYMAKSGHTNIHGVGRDARKAFRCIELGITLFPLPTELVDGVWITKIVKFVAERENLLQ